MKKNPHSLNYDTLKEIFDEIHACIPHMEKALELGKHEWDNSGDKIVDKLEDIAYKQYGLPKGNFNKQIMFDMILILKNYIYDYRHID